MLIRQGGKKENFRFIENDVRNFEILKVLRLRQQRSGDRSPVADDEGQMIFLFSDGQDADHLTVFSSLLQPKVQIPVALAFHPERGKCNRQRRRAFAVLCSSSL